MNKTLLLLSVSVIMSAPINSFARDNSGGSEQGHEYVDLGLPSGTKWATCNIGARTPEDYGDYFKWAEVKPEKSDGESKTYRTVKGDIAGSTQYDAATVLWGGNWHIPTKEETQELIDNCEWTFVAEDDRFGYEVVGPNGNEIFLPAAGTWWSFGGIRREIDGRYWLSSPSEVTAKSSYLLSFMDPYTPDGELENTSEIIEEERWHPNTIRPVLSASAGKAGVQKEDFWDTMIAKMHIPDLNPDMFADLGLPSGNKWAYNNLGGSLKSAQGLRGKTFTREDLFPMVFEYRDFVSEEIDSMCITPNKKDWEELFSNCEFNPTKIHGVEGMVFTGSTGRSIFIPGAIKYALPELEIADNDSVKIQYYPIFQPDVNDLTYSLRPIMTADGHNNVTGLVAKMMEPDIVIDGMGYVDLKLPSGNLWAVHNIGADSPEKPGNNYEAKEIFTPLLSEPESTIRNQKLGEWTLPTIADYRELKENARLYSVKIGDDKKSGTLVVGKNGKMVLFHNLESHLAFPFKLVASSEKTEKDGPPIYEFVWEYDEDGLLLDSYLLHTQKYKTTKNAGDIRWIYWWWADEKDEDSKKEYENTDYWKHYGHLRPILKQK